MKPRSPVLGYNHNVRYAGRTWHVQTEDSGVQAPHVYTHLFHEGTILASKKSHYDPSSDVTLVQKLMQTQHKLMLRELKSGTYDEKIEKIYGPIVRDPGDRADTGPELTEAAPAVAPPAEEERPRTPPVVAAAPRVSTPRPPSSEDERATVPDLGPLLPPPPAQPPTSPAPPRATPSPPSPSPAEHAPMSAAFARPRQASLTPARPAVAVTARSGPGGPPSSPPPTIGGGSGAPLPRSAPPTIGSGRSGAQQGNRAGAAESIIVGRPTVIVGKDAGKKGEAADFWKTNERRQPDPSFGGDLISEKSLDEVILAYLSEDAPKK